MITNGCLGVQRMVSGQAAAVERDEPDSQTKKSDVNLGPELELSQSRTLVRMCKAEVGFEGVLRSRHAVSDRFS